MSRKIDIANMSDQDPAPSSEKSKLCDVKRSTVVEDVVDRFSK